MHLDNTIPEAEGLLPCVPWDGRDVSRLFDLEALGDDRFRAYCNQPNVNDALYGGQVVAQALAAATRTVEGRSVHSLHAYFIRPGSNLKRVSFRLERLRDGRNFNTRRVVATQADRLLLELTCSFAQPNPGYYHSAVLPDVPPPEELHTLHEIARAGGDDLPPYIRTFLRSGPVELKPMARGELLAGTGKSQRDFWVRAPGAGAIARKEDKAILLAYLSDYWLASAALTAHRSPCPGDDLFVASLDHALWFHDSVERPDDWMLFHTDSPQAQGGIGTSRGLIFDRAGRLLASATQQALQLPGGAPSRG